MNDIDLKKIGQLFFTGISGLKLNSQEEIFLESENIGGVVLFSHNYESPAQLAELTNSIQDLRQKRPFFICTDQEGGRVQRFKDPFCVFPSFQEQALLESPKVIFEINSIIAKELKACGINLNLSPCCDVLTNPKNKVIGDRSFSSESDQVQKYISAVIRGLQTNGVLACLKHFPGHGMTTLDSHDSLPTVERSLEELEKIDIPPFKKGIKSKAHFLMVAHLLVDAFGDLPTSLNPKCYEFIRKEMRFKGLIITDDMQMGAINKNYTVGEAAVKALVAGADILEYRDLDQTKLALEAVHTALKNEQIPWSLIQEKLERIDNIKKKEIPQYEPISITDLNTTFSCKSSQVFCEDLINKINSLKKSKEA